MYQLLVSIVKAVVGWKFKITVQDAQNIPRYGPVVVVFNHTDFLDIIAIMFAIRHNLTAFLSYTHQRNPFVRLFNLTKCVIFVSRGTKDTEALQNAITLLNEDGWLVVAPEGTRGGDVLSGVQQITRSVAELGRGRYGVAYIVAESSILKDVPILPIGIIGATGGYSRLVKGPFFERIKITVRIGAPFTLDTTSVGDLSDLEARGVKDKLAQIVNAQVMPRIAELIPEDMRGSFA
ncbi:1-acyl-sn-glycerol-3-phosphate acyltransferase [candidate division WWE3 bacterium]|uniref:1-acyl-sn-glycerol-3-phosphate acyltransferase n=1 Tax=candidate division WWE3 bacterium TaxID=2053526 RepID=A0A955LJQ3_UNCKA|nr:1-acyl-sn-glycerol-3-phosphate acyltransferase [candidate division WWE3 bacterium]